MNWGWLVLDAGKTESVLGFSRNAGRLIEGIKRTMAWYRAYGAGADARQLCEADIAEFTTGKIAQSLS